MSAWKEGECTDTFLGSSWDFDPLWI